MNLDQMYSDARREGKVEGKAEGLAKGLLAVLEIRGLPVSLAQRKQVLACTDAAQLEAWLLAAKTTTSAKVLLSGSARR